MAKHKKRAKIWNEILKRPAILSEEEADYMEKVVKKLRKEYGFRKIKKF